MKNPYNKRFGVVKTFVTVLAKDTPRWSRCVPESRQCHGRPWPL